MLRRAVRIGESWFGNDPSHEKLALWRVKLAGSFSHQVRSVWRCLGVRRPREAGAQGRKATLRTDVCVLF